MRGARLGPALVAVALLLCGCTGIEAEGDLAAGRSRLTVVPVPAGSSAPAPPEPAAPDPAPPDPAPPEPAAPDPAPPDPAPPDPAAPHPGSPDTDAVDAAELAEAAQAALPESPIAVACDDVVAALTDAVVRYEAVALAEGAGGGDRMAAAADMRAAWQEAWAAADRVGAGLPAAAAPAMAAVTVLHDGLTTRATLDESDADAWRDAREALQDWCRARG